MKSREPDSNQWPKDFNKDSILQSSALPTELSRDVLQQLPFYTIIKFSRTTKYVIFWHNKMTCIIQIKFHFKKFNTIITHFLEINNKKEW